MKKKYHIKKTTEIEQVMRNKKFLATKSIVVYTYNNTKTTNLRYALSVGKKIGDAHHRNKIKRRIRSILQEICDPSFIIDIFIVARPLINDLTYQDIKTELFNLLTKLKIKLKCEVAM